MKTIGLKVAMPFAAIIVGILLLAGQAHADTWVQGYFRQDGTYVQPHYRSDPDGSQMNNWNTYGNTNPYTLQQGTRVINPLTLMPPQGYMPRQQNFTTCYSWGNGNVTCY